MQEIEQPAKSPEQVKPTRLLEGEGSSGRGVDPEAANKLTQLLKRTISGLRSDRGGDLVFTSLDDKADAKEKEAREAAEKAVKALVSDAKAGKWGKESKAALKRIFDEFKKDGATPEEMYSGLNKVGALINGSLKADGSKNTVGLAQATENGEVTFRMTLNGPKIDKVANLKAVLDKKDIDSVYTVGKMPEVKKKKE